MKIVFRFSMLIDNALTIDYSSQCVHILTYVPTIMLYLFLKHDCLGEHLILYTRKTRHIISFVSRLYENVQVAGTAYLTKPINVRLVNTLNLS